MGGGLQSLSLIPACKNVSKFEKIEVLGRLTVDKSRVGCWDPWGIENNSIDGSGIDFMNVIALWVIEIYGFELAPETILPQSVNELVTICWIVSKSHCFQGTWGLQRQPCLAGIVFFFVSQYFSPRRKRLLNPQNFPNPKKSWDFGISPLFSKTKTFFFFYLLKMN